MDGIKTIEREYGCGAGEIARQLSLKLGWKLWDRELTAEIARVANVDSSAVSYCEERVDSTFQRLVKVFWRGSYEHSMHLENQTFDPDRMVHVGEQVMRQIADEGNAIIVGRGAPYFLRDRSDTFHVFLYAPRAEKLRRVRDQGTREREAEDLVDSVDRERIDFVKHYFEADWPTRSLYHVLLNTAMAGQHVISSILHHMRTIAG